MCLYKYKCYRIFILQFVPYGRETEDTNNLQIIMAVSVNYATFNFVYLNINITQFYGGTTYIAYACMCVC